MRSRIEMIPATFPPSMTGRWRNPPWIMNAAACSVESDASIVSGFLVIQSRTLALSAMPIATALRMSRSVRMPSSRPPSRTRTAPTPRETMCCAASATDSSACAVRSSRDMWLAIADTGRDPKGTSHRPPGGRLLGDRFELVADAVAGLDERVRRAEGLQLVPDLADEDVDGAIAVRQPPPPDLLEQ